MNFMSCSTTTSEWLPSRERKSSAVRSVSSSVMPATGSSSSSSFGSCISSMPISSHCFWPCDSSPATRCALLCATILTAKDDPCTVHEIVYRVAQHKLQSHILKVSHHIYFHPFPYY